jgi:hypothetical protein
VWDGQARAEAIAAGDIAKQVIHLTQSAVSAGVRPRA